jgi:hypothetical protein
MPDAIDKLLADSRHIIEAWEALGVPGGRPDENLRVIREHMLQLVSVSKARPSLAFEVQDLALRYGAMATKIRLRSN